VGTGQQQGAQGVGNVKVTVCVALCQHLTEGQLHPGVSERHMQLADCMGVSRHALAAAAGPHPRLATHGGGQKTLLSAASGCRKQQHPLLTGTPI
jgi:hypothetical protein